MKNIFKTIRKYESREIPRRIINKIIKENNLKGLEGFLAIFSSKEFILHGTQKELRTLKSHKSNCINEDGNLSGIYGTKDPKIAIFKSLVPKLKNSVSSYSYEKNKYSFSMSYNCLKKFSNGYVYVLEGKNFIRLQNNYISKKSLNPIFVIKTRKKDFKEKINIIKDSEDINKRNIKKIVFREYIHLDKNGAKAHILNVVKNAELIAKETCPKNIKDAIIGAYLHDIGRINKIEDRRHAFRGMLIAKKILIKHWPDLDVKRILYAIEHHADGKTTKDPLIGSIWDADRLDLIRLNTKININLLSTKKAKKMLKQNNSKISVLFRKLIQKLKRKKTDKKLDN